MVKLPINRILDTNWSVAVAKQNCDFNHAKLPCVNLSLDLSIGVGAQSTLGEQDIFARKYMHEKLTECPNFT